MTDPLEIIEAALADAHDLGMTDALYAKAIVRALEKEGFVIVDPENVTDGVLGAAGAEVLTQYQDHPEWEEAKDVCEGLDEASIIYAALIAAHPEQFERLVTEHKQRREWLIKKDAHQRARREN